MHRNIVKKTLRSGIIKNITIYSNTTEWNLNFWFPGEEKLPSQHSFVEALDENFQKAQWKLKLKTWRRLRLFSASMNHLRCFFFHINKVFIFQFKYSSKSYMSQHMEHKFQSHSKKSASLWRPLWWPKVAPAIYSNASKRRADWCHQEEVFHLFTWFKHRKWVAVGHPMLGYVHRCNHRQQQFRWVNLLSRACSIVSHSPDLLHR